ncbi:hypothetical protein M9458_045412, partial [Cirrhinus mrigala]
NTEALTAADADTAAAAMTNAAIGAVYLQFINSRVCGSGVCDGQRSSLMIQYQP